MDQPAPSRSQDHRPLSPRSSPTFSSFPLKITSTGYLQLCVRRKSKGFFKFLPIARVIQVCLHEFMYAEQSHLRPKIH
jgi:hypothetical protein